MAYDKYEVDLVKRCVQEIIDENFKGILHELRKKLTAAEAKQATYAEKVASYERELEILRECHKCHYMIVDRQDSQTQCDLKDFELNISARDVSTSRPAKLETATTSETIQQKPVQQRPDVSLLKKETVHHRPQTNGKPSPSKEPECIDLVDDSD